MPIPPRELLDNPAAYARALASPDAIGLLASFAPESTDTVALLRMYRAGARPVCKQGFLHKRKRAAWRERAPLGPLAWKRRYFVLEPTHITYYGSNPATSSSSAAKGVIPLTGWVEVSRAGAESGAVNRALSHDSTSRPHCFIVRTGSTHHVFQAASDADCEAWVAAIAVNAQHVGMAQDDPHCVILRDAADTAKLAAALQQRRRDLLAAMSAEARSVAEAQFEVDLSVASAGSSSASAAGHGYAHYEEEDEDWEEVDGGGGEASPDEYDDGEDDDGDEAGPDPEGGLSLPDAIAIADASGGLSDDIVAQCCEPVQVRLLRHYRRRLARSEAEERQRLRGTAAVGAPRSGSRNPTFTPVRLASGERALVASHAPVGMAAAPGHEIGVLSRDGRTIVVPSGGGGGSSKPPLGGAVEGGWLYLDDSDVPQGPFSDSVMRSWLYAGYLRPDICVRFALPLPGQLDAAEGVNEEFVPQVYIPLSVLFTDPAAAFVPGNMSWLAPYKLTARYQHLYITACNMGLDRSAALRQVYAMKENDLPADLSILLDMCGVSDLASLRRQHLVDDVAAAAAPEQAAPHA